MLDAIISYSQNIVKEKTLLKNTIFTTFSMLLKSGLQVGYFVIVARTLGPEEYGAFGATLALIAIFAPYSTFGSGYLLIKHASRNRQEFRTYWGASLAVVLIMGSLLTILVLSIYGYFLPNSITFTTVFIICISDLVLIRSIDISSQAFQSFEMISRMNVVQIIMSALKFACALLLLIPIFNRTIDTWVLFYFLSSLIGSIYAVYIVNKVLGKGILNPKPILIEAKEGLYFSIGDSASSVYNDIDKTMLSKYSTLESTGIYLAAYRLIDATMTPMRAFLTSLYTRFFVAGEKGVHGTLPLVKRMTPYGFGYGVIACVGMLSISGFIPAILGPEYSSTVLVIRLLSPIIIFRSIHNMLGDSLAGAGLQGIRSGIQIMVGVINIGLNLYLIPSHGLIGAIVSSVVCNLLLLLMLGATLVRNRMKTTYLP